MYRTLDSSKIVATLEVLERRVAERFPDASLTRVCEDLTRIARENDERARLLARPNYALRMASGVVLAIGAALFGYVTVTIIALKRETGNVFEVLQGIEAGFNILILMSIGVLFLTTLEARWKRQQALADLDELRSVVHVIDMHQLTKDPAARPLSSSPTPSSPRRSLTPFELVRYLDYCSEMLSLAAKVAAVYAQSSKDPQVIEASSDLQQITANLSAKIWQKINIAQTEARLAELDLTTATASSGIGSTAKAATPTPQPVAGAGKATDSGGGEFG